MPNYRYGTGKELSKLWTSNYARKKEIAQSYEETKRENVEYFICPENFNDGDLKWEDRISFLVPENMMSADFYRNKKVKALDQHVNALKLDAVHFLYSFIAMEELFWKIDY